MCGIAQQMICLTNHLHIGVLDAIVHHLDKVTGTIWANVCAAGNVINMGGDRLQQWAK